MIADFHFLRPAFLIALIPLLLLAWHILKQTPSSMAWQEVCDRHLLQHLMQSKGSNNRRVALYTLFFSAFCMIVALSGPAWSKLPVPVYKPLQAKILILDLSLGMLEKDLAPDRLSRAKFKIQDILRQPGSGQYGMIVYSGEPFIVSPLTDDSQTIDSLLPSLSADIMPVEGHNLRSALLEAQKLVKQAGDNQAEILILSANPPSADAISEAANLANQSIRTSIIPMTLDANQSPAFAALAKAGRGLLLPFSDTSSDLDAWFSQSSKAESFAEDLQNDFPIWRDQGRWFLIPALLAFAPVFRRGFLQGLSL